MENDFFGQSDEAQATEFQKACMEEAIGDKKAMISKNLLDQINELMNGARIEKVSSNDEYHNLLTVVDLAKKTRADAEAERKRKKEPWDRGAAEVQAAFKPKIDFLDDFIKSHSSVAGRYEIEQRRIAEEEERKKIEAARSEQKRLAEIESKRLEEEERLRQEALAKQAAAEAEADPEKKAALVEQANTAAAVADVAAQEAIQAAQAITEVTVERVETKIPMHRGFKAKIEYKAKVNDYRKALKGFVDTGEYGYLEGEAFKKLIDAACNKIAKNKAEKFEWPGCVRVEDVGSSFRTRNAA